MGLAASQGRYLLLSSRKNDVEYRLMSIANQKLSLSRKSSELSENYSNALNATKKSLTTDFSYSNVMTYNPNATNQYVLTDANDGNKVILTSALATTFGLSGSSGAPGQLPTDAAGRAAILSGATGINDPAKVLAYLTSAGTSGTSGASTGSNYPSYNDQSVISAAGLSSAYNSTVPEVLCKSRQGYGYAGLEDFDAATIYTAFANKLNGVAQNLGKALESALNVPSGELSTYIQIAYDATLLQFTGGAGENLSVGKGSEANHGNVYYTDSGDQDTCQLAAVGSNRITFTEGGTNRGKVVVDMKQVINTFLNYFDVAYKHRNSQEFGKIDTGAELYTACNTNNYTNVDGMSMYSYGGCFRCGGPRLVNSGTNQVWGTSTHRRNKGSDEVGGAAGANGLTGADEHKLNWYLNLYNSINQNGWTTKTDVSNQNTLQTGILNGSINLQQIGANGLLTNSTDDYISEEEDEAAIQRAQAEYEADKDKLNYKETVLDLHQHNLDTELSAVNTEMESVKKIIDNNIKIFKMFDA